MQPNFVNEEVCSSLSVSLRFAAGKAAFTEAPAAFREEERRSLQAEAAASTKVQSLSRKGTRKVLLVAQVIGYVHTLICAILDYS